MPKDSGNLEDAEPGDKVGPGLTFVGRISRDDLDKLDVRDLPKGEGK
jgi:hypothetical protein